MGKKLEGKIALVTGGGRGIGKGCALELAKQGATVVINDRPDSPDLESCTREIRNLGGTVYAIEADVFSRAGCQALLERALHLTGQIDILISNPAFSVRQPFLEFDPDLFEKIIHATLISGFHISQLVARHMVEQSIHGKIIFISSVHARIPYKTALPYNASKAGLNHMARTIAGELADYRINVNVIEPGWIDTQGEREMLGKDSIAEAGAQLPWKRLGTPQDIGKAVVFLASDDSDYITGSVLRVDGGFIDKDM